ncbi:MAG: hypothetical protein KatS3mg110_1778 [Pirellulaceae bacterium]|nr:MAG: hypothetical protein KatS3mg110_1778 [Pirellulaceae bacterium]
MMGLRRWASVALPFRTVAAVALGILAAGKLDSQEASTGHVLLRPPPVVLPDEPLLEDAYYVDARHGSDDFDGSRQRPWRTVQHAVDQLRPGDVLYVRGGIYYEKVAIRCSGMHEAPIVVRSYPGELAILDGGLREFYETPGEAWQPNPDGVPGEFISTRSYPDGDTRRAPRQFLPGAWEPFWGREQERPLAMGFFADTMIALHGYRRLQDLRSDNELFAGKADERPLYCGPGLWFNRRTGRIHVRLAHTRLEGLGAAAYRGPTDPRQVPLVVAVGFGDDVLRLTGISHVRIEGLVVRGATGSPLIAIYGCDGVELERVTAYGGFPALLLDASRNIKVRHCAFRGNAAPWSSRAHMKYYGTPSYQIIFYNSQPINENIEIAWCEFTDDHDFAFFRFVRNLQFHHNYVDNFNDDGLECGPKLRDHSIYIYQNYLGSALIPFSQHEIAPDESPQEHGRDSGIYVFRNIIDLRNGVYVAPPAQPDATGKFLHQEGHLASDHGSPIWPVMRFYHNTIVRRTATFRQYYLFGLAAQGLRSTERDVFNNIFIQTEGTPGVVLPAPSESVRLREGGNLIWGPSASHDPAENPLERFRLTPQFLASQRLYAPGWTGLDLFADPLLAALGSESGELDARLRPGSPAIDRGVALPDDWPDPLRGQDAGLPDIGAIPAGIDLWGVGIDGRLPFGPAICAASSG